MPTEKEHKIQTLDYMVDEKFAEIFFLAKEEYNIESNSDTERQLYQKLDSFKRDLREFGGAL